ncbi:MAG: DNA-directed DNA polymerase [Nanoarchaeota archaeon]|jgi:DNA polymerase elongation subunit (family B)|nr:DNA-directed DNA polymerase [Nanoarchaeota archaeon]
MTKKFIPIDYDYFDYDGKNHVKIFGRDETNEQICIIDTCPIFMWAILKENVTKKQIIELIKEVKEVYVQTKDRTTTIEKVETHEKNYSGKKVVALKIFATNYKDLSSVASKLDNELIDKRRGYDLGFTTHYIIEKKLNPLVWYDIETTELEEDDYDFIKNELKTEKVLKLNSHRPSTVDSIPSTDFTSRSLAYDIETDSLKPELGAILMISLYGKDFKKVITWKKGPTTQDYVEFVEDEKALLKTFLKHVEEYKPDFLVGYNSDAFDMPYIKTRAKMLKIKFPIGLDKSEPKIRKGIPPTTKITGITHLDLYKFVKTAYAQYMQSETLSLNDVASEFLGEKKIPFVFKHSKDIKENEWDLYYRYNLKDSDLAFQLFEKFLPDMIEFSKVVKEPIFEASRNGLSKQIEGYILHNLEKFNEIPERKPNQKETGARMQQGQTQGAFVFKPTAGLYEDLGMFDFTSMHTSIIISHNISKGTLIEPSTVNSQPSTDYNDSPEIKIDGKNIKYHFTKEPGFFPLLLQEIFDKRKQFKKEYNENPNPMTKARSNAFKVLSASAHGYIAFSGARYYSKEAAESILAFVRQYNQETIQKIKDAGQKIIYGDTDSVVFTLEGKSESTIKELLKKINSELPGVMNLELEGFFKRGLWVNTRGGETGAKKKYAMITENGIVKIRGFETVRRDWCELARKTQDHILRLILKQGNEKESLKYVKEIIKQLKERKISKDKLIIRTQLKKPITEYKAISPHVTAAIKMQKQGMAVGIGSLIEYYIGNTGGSSKLVRDKALLKNEDGEYDITYYLKKQMLPSVDQIFQVFGIDIKEVIDGQKQENLKKWF